MLYDRPMFRQLAAVGLVAAAACCSKSDVKSAGQASAPAPTKPSFTLFALAELRGQIGPCGCTSDPLGDISRTVQVVDAARTLGADTVTLARRKDVSFSIPVFPGGIGALLRADASARLREALTGQSPQFRPVWRGAALGILQSKGFAVIAGTTAEKWLAARVADLDVVTETTTVDSYAAGVQRAFVLRDE